MGRLCAFPLVLLVLAGCPTGITGLECSTNEDCLESNESCERGVCVVFRPDAAPPGGDAGAPRADAGRPKADAGRPDASQTADTGPVLPDAGDAGASADTGIRPDGGPGSDASRADAGLAKPDAAHVPVDAGSHADAGRDAGMPPDAASCGANEEPGPSGCVPVFSLTILSPIGAAPAHGLAAVQLERIPGTTSPEPATVRLKLTGKNAGALFMVDLTPAAGKYTALYDLSKSGAYQVEASFELNGRFAVTGLAQVKPTFGTPRPAYPPSVRADPMLPGGSFVRGLAGTVFVPVDVENVTPDAAMAEVKDAKDNEAPATASWVGCGATQDCPCNRTTLGCLALTSDFYAANLFLEVRAQYLLHGGLSDDEGQPVDITVPVAVSRWRWAYSLPAGYRIFAPPVILPGGLVLAPTSSGPASPTATTTVLLALDPNGAQVDSSDPLGGTAVRLATRAGTGGQLLAVVTQTLTGEDLYTGFFTGASTGLFSSFKQHNPGAGAALSRLGVAWLVPAGAHAPVLALVHVKTNDRNAQLKSWDPAADMYVPASFPGTLLSPALPISADGANLYVGTSDGGHAQFKFLPSEIQAGPVTGRATEPTTFLVGPGQAWVSQALNTALLFQPGLSGDSLTGQVLGLLGAVEGPLVVLPSSIWPGKWGQNGATPLSFAANAPTGGLVAHGDTLYLVAPSQNTGTFDLLRRTSKGVTWASTWNLPGIPASEPALDCLRGSAASLGVLYVPLLDGRLVALVVDEPGLDQDAPWPQTGRDPGRSYNTETPLACP